jgi:hypothetical protein
MDPGAETPQAAEAAPEENAPVMDGTNGIIQADGTDYVLTPEDVHEFMEHFSGKDAEGNSRSVVSYQCYNAEEAGKSLADRDIPIFTLQKPYVQISYDELNPQLALMDLVFPSYDDQELRILWARMQKWRRETAETPVFFFHLLERATVSTDSAKNDVLVEANIMNPVIFTLTRELPTTQAVDAPDMDGVLAGGNVIRMMLNMSLVSFEVSGRENTSDIKAEVQREMEEERYVNGAVPEQLWQ